MAEEVLRFAHVIGAAVLLGTGAGIAFFMVMAVRTRDPALIAHVSGTVVVADVLFTATAVVVQPITGYLLARQIGWSLGEGWIVLSLMLYVIVGLFWLPVVWIQIRLRELARRSAGRGEPLLPAFDRLYRIWFAFGFPAFFAVLGIFWLMLTRPELAL
ncbi:DUF2269 domain-containing protein [uncultured Hoeflea sp.]|uniref:DUF2269 family protein n=1 Tax=uncultured Hoeflea sp. TaxID=538666 RepID=UPI00260DED01|nr:DUF2269 domain-containing protein [uncultured Hoeflea sp.]